MTKKLNMRQLSEILNDDLTQLNQKTAKITTVYQKGSKDEHSRSTVGKLVLNKYTNGTIILNLIPEYDIDSSIFLANSRSRFNQVVDFIEVF